jgi:hypothetical protein
MLRKLLLFATTFLTFTMGVFAQTPLLKVSVSAGDSEGAKEVAELLRAKIGSTLRYGLSEATTADILIEVLCVPFKPQGSDAVSHTVACTEPTTYFAPKAYGLARTLQTTIAIGDRSSVAEGLFDTFVVDTSAEKLELAEKDITIITDDIRAAGYSFGLSAGRDICKGKSSGPTQKN